MDLIDEVAKEMIELHGVNAEAQCLSILNGLQPDVGRAYYITFDFYKDVLHEIRFIQYG